MSSIYMTTLFIASYSISAGERLNGLIHNLCHPVPATIINKKPPHFLRDGLL
jgi:hypothetical protein